MVQWRLNINIALNVAQKWRNKKIMNDYIKREDAINLFKRDDIHGFVLPEKEKEYLAWCIERVPSADVVEHKHGEWILECDAEGERDNLYRCSECRQEYGCQEYDLPNFCPNCGAEMIMLEF